MPPADFTDALAKLERADEHIADIERIIEGFLATKFYELVVDTDQDTGYARLSFNSTHHIDKRLNTITGDAIGNLRSCLDYIYLAVTFPVTGIKDKGGFPFADDAAGFKGMVKKGGIERLGPIAIDFFINQVQVYKGGSGETFWILNKLRNIDKHRLLIATLSFAGAMVSGKFGPITMTNTTLFAEPGRNSVLTQLPIHKIEFTSAPKPAFKVHLNEPSCASFVEVVPFLKQAQDMTQNLIQNLQTLGV